MSNLTPRRFTALGVTLVKRIPECVAEDILTICHELDRIQCNTGPERMRQVLDVMVAQLSEVE